MNNNNIHIETLGCRLNQIESESTAQNFLQKDFSVSMQPISANTEVSESVMLSIINTCTVTLKAEQKARRLIRLMLKTFPQSVIIVTGCYAQLSPEEIKKIDSRIFVLPGQLKSRITEIPDLLKNYLSENSWNKEEFHALLNEKISIVPVKKDFPEDSFKLSATSFLAHSRASLKIQDGCNSSCSYCAIHIARGHSVSIDVETALKRVLELEENNYDEVVITTVNIAQYRSIYNGEVYDFTKLLKYLLDNTTKINFRISSLYPQIVNEEFCSVISNDRVRPHFHISVQSGSNKILESMNRAYKRDAVIQACEKIRKVKPNVFLACDIITGFPGESDEDFMQTMDLCKICDFAWVHAFPYSERPGTPAVKFKNKVPQSVSGERAKQITAWAIENKIKYINKNKGKILSAVLETKKNLSVMAIDNQTYIYHGMTENFIHCEIKSTKIYELNKMVKVEIQSPLEDRIRKGGDIEASAIIIE